MSNIEAIACAIHSPDMEKIDEEQENLSEIVDPINEQDSAVITQNEVPEVVVSENVDDKIELEILDPKEGSESPALDCSDAFESGCVPVDDTFEHLNDEDEKTEEDVPGEKPPKFSWIEEGMFATCATPNHHDHYKWLIGSNFTHLITLGELNPKQVVHHKQDLEHLLIRVPKYSIIHLDEIGLKILKF